MTPPAPRTAPRSSPLGLVGLAIAGWGLSILVGFVPHEDLLVAVGLLAFGGAMVAVCGLPSLGRLPRWPLALLGAALALGIPAYVLLSGAAIDPAKAVLSGLGALMLALLPLHARAIPLPRGRATDGASLSVCAAATVGGPGAVYVLQALMVKGTGTTPVEAFLQFALLAPVAAAAGWFGWNPVLEGQLMTYDGVHGPLRVEVGAACSGIQAMALFAVILAVYMLARRPPAGAMLAWSAIGLAGIYVANLLRLVTIIAVGHWHGPTALEETHANAGWAFFVAWALLFAWLVRRAERPAAMPVAPR